MEIKDINPTAKATFTVKGRDGSKQVVSFDVTYLGQHMIPDYVRGGETRMSRVIQEALVDSVVSWDLTLEGGRPIPCTDENKRKFFPALLELKLWKEPEEAPEPGFILDDFLGWALVTFASVAENFLKN
jgi:hypothetical protein